MTAIEIFTLIFLVFFLAAGIGFSYSKHHGSLKDMVQDVKDLEVQAQQISNELYNKDLRPVVEKKAPKKKVVEDLSVTAEEISPETAKPKKKRKYYPRKPKTSI